MLDDQFRLHKTAPTRVARSSTNEYHRDLLEISSTLCPLCTLGWLRDRGPTLGDLVSIEAPEDEAVKLHLLPDLVSVQRQIFRHMTLSPSAVMSSIVKCKSGMDLYMACIIFSSPPTPVGFPPGPS
jgi:hypothetical protein